VKNTDRRHLTMAAPLSSALAADDKGSDKDFEPPHRLPAHRPELPSPNSDPG